MASAETGPFKPSPSAVQALPFHLATRLGVKNIPPAYSSGPFATSAATLTPNPDPNGDQLVPSHLATWFAATTPAFEKFPPT